MIPSNYTTISRRPPIISGSLIVPLNEGNRLVSSKKLENINCIFSPSDTLGGLYLGDVVSTLKQDLLRGHNIRAILTCMCQRVSINPLVNCHKILPIKDILEYPIIQHFDEAVAWIEEKRKEKFNVLVHCHAGVSRSATIVIAYLIRTQKWNPFQAFEFVKQQRERAKPNASFWNQINEYYNYWSKQAGNHAQQELSTKRSKENNSFLIAIPQKMASQVTLSKRNQAGEENKKKQEEKFQRNSIGNQNTIKESDVNKQEKDKTSLKRKKIFEKPILIKGMPEATKTQELFSSYYINPTVNSALKPHTNIHFRNNSIIMEDSRFSMTKSTLQPRNSLHSESLFKTRIDSSTMISGRPSLRPEIKFSQKPFQGGFVSPFEARDLVRFP